MTIKTTEKFEELIFVGEDGKEEIISLAASCIPVPVEAPKQNFRGITVDAKHPFVVHIAGVPVFSASSKCPDRVKAMVAGGIPPQVFQILDARNGTVYGVNGARK